MLCVCTGLPVSFHDLGDMHDFISIAIEPNCQCLLNQVPCKQFLY